MGQSVIASLFPICNALILQQQLNTMEKILDELEGHPNWKEAMRASCRKNGINTILAAELTIIKLRQLEERFRKSSLEKMATFWIENQLKAYNWLLLAVSALTQTLIKDFTEQQWLMLKRVFIHKDMVFLRFEARRLIESKTSKNRWWSDEEDQLLMREVAKHESEGLNWNEIAHQMFQASAGAVFRSGKHCREHWLNHLDPNKHRGAWTIEEDSFLLERVINGGKKWSEYANVLKRTEHTVKNRFNSLVIKQKKLTPQIKKEERLIKELRTRLEGKLKEENPSKEDEREMLGYEQEVDAPEQADCREEQVSVEQKEEQMPNIHIIQQAKEEAVIKPVPASEYPLKHQRIEEAYECERDKGEKIQVQNPLSNYSPVPVMIPNYDLNFFIKEDNQDLKQTIFSEFPRYSPYSPYSPYMVSPNTPNSYIPSAPLYVTSQFYNYYNQFMSHTDMANQDNGSSTK